MPRILWRVVCGLEETIESLRLRSAFSSVDLPAFGRPSSTTKPALKFSDIGEYYPHFMHVHKMWIAYNGENDRDHDLGRRDGVRAAAGRRAAARRRARGAAGARRRARAAARPAA